VQKLERLVQLCMLLHAIDSTHHFLLVFADWSSSTLSAAYVFANGDFKAWREGELSLYVMLLAHLRRFWLDSRELFNLAADRTPLAARPQRQFRDSSLQLDKLVRGLTCPALLLRKSADGIKATG
jgi:hypothetical protein